MVGVVSYNKSIYLYSCFISELSGGDVKASSILVTVKHGILNPGSGEVRSTQRFSPPVTQFVDCVPWAVYATPSVAKSAV